MSGKTMLALLAVGCLVLAAVPAQAQEAAGVAVNNFTKFTPVARDAVVPAGETVRFNLDAHNYGRVSLLIAGETRPEAGPGRTLVDRGKLPRGQVEQGGDERDPGRHGQAGPEGDGGPGGVKHGPRRTGPIGSPAGAERRAAEDEGVAGGRDGDEWRRREHPAPGDGERRPALGRVPSIDPLEDEEGFPGDRRGDVGADEGVEIDGRERGMPGFLERPEIDDDADAVAGRRARHRSEKPRPRSSSQRSRSTTIRASAMIRRLILDAPTRRSRKMMGISRTRAPSRLARYVISIWKT